MNERIYKDIEKLLRETRRKLEKAWSIETGSNLTKETMKGRPASFGQCGTTCALLLPILKEMFPREFFSIASGVIYSLKERRSLGGSHVWLVWYNGSPRDAMIMDITADQFDEISEPVIFDNVRSLGDNRGLVYSAGFMFSKNPSERAEKWAEILRKRVSA
ncbi:MAG: hypothetical protein LBQ02_04110 [Candidatus Nomurabacteria bacterium]|jgi:hypothetical protein|nr:hypothetical protein [Candidatus Nomurabacteria bacterium]